MTLRETLQDDLAEAGISSTLRQSHTDDQFLAINKDVEVHIMLDIVALGGKPYVVFHPGLASPHMNTGAEVAAYLRKENLL